MANISNEVRIRALTLQQQQHGDHECTGDMVRAIVEMDDFNYEGKQGRNVSALYANPIDATWLRENHCDLETRTKMVSGCCLRTARRDCWGYPHIDCDPVAHSTATTTTKNNLCRIRNGLALSVTETILRSMLKTTDTLNLVGRKAQMGWSGVLRPATRICDAATNELIRDYFVGTGFERGCWLPLLPHT